MKGKLPEQKEIRKQIQTMNELLQDMDVDIGGHDLGRQVSYIIGYTGERNETPSS